ncbi:MAG: TetR/AcrR family transcriptional regulator [bacterium]|nr:TetR/AcrR family transcriptional regulator [bacterium]
MGNREKVLQAALELFNEQGTAGVTTNHIAKAAGVSPGSLYYHFKNKEAIILTLFEEMECCFDEVMEGASTTFVPSSFEDMELYFNQISESEWKYRFFSRETANLLQSEALRQAFLERQAIRQAQIKGTILGMIENRLVRPIPEERVDQLVQIIWLVSIFWNPYLVLSGQESTKERMAQSMVMVRTLVEPYLIAPQG